MSEIRSQATHELVVPIHKHVCAANLEDCTGECYLAAAALQNAGWSKPRTVNSVEELEALPPRSVIELPDGEIGMIMVARDKRHVVGYPQCIPTSELSDVIRSTHGDPIRVLFTPGDERAAGVVARS